MPTILPAAAAAAAATRCSASFPRLTQEDLRPLLDLGRRYLGCDHLAQDALQEALLAMSQQPELPERPLAWLTRAIIHRCRHLRRTLHRRRHYEHAASQHCELHVGCDNPLHIAMAHELGELVDAARDTLTDEQRTALEMFESEGNNYQQIADRLGIPIGTVRSRLARARHAFHAVARRWQEES